MEINIGDYVRTKSNGIKQIYEIDNKKSKYKYLFKLKKQDGDGCVDLGQLCNDNITKHSKDIIDLVQVGDYVNGREVTSFGYDHNDKIIYVNTISCLSFENDEIKSVLTKKQFESNAYTIEKER